MAVAGLGVALLLGAAPHVVVTHVPRLLSEDVPAAAVLGVAELALLVGPAVGLLYAAGRLERSDLDRRHRWTVASRALGTAALVAAVVGALKLHQHLDGVQVVRHVAVMELLTGVGMGGVLGLGLGRYTARARAQAERLGDQRDAFAFLNEVLRHHVLNGVQVVDGYAARLETRLDGPEAELAGGIRERSDDVVERVESVRAVADTFSGDPSLEPVDLSALLGEELERVRRNNPETDVRASVPEGVRVRSTPLLSAVFGHLLANAVEHGSTGNRAEPGDAVERESAAGRVDGGTAGEPVGSSYPHPDVEVRVERREERVAVRVADRGPGLPDDRGWPRSALPPERTADAGFGLVLVERVVTHHEGTVTVEEDDEGTTVVVELPAA